MKIFKRLLAYLPTELPVGMTTLNSWLDDIVELAGPIADRDSVVFVAGHECVQLPNTKNRISKMAVVKRIKKYAYNQCMSVILKEINDKHIAAKMAEQQSKATESTTSEKETAVQ